MTFTERLEVFGDRCQYCSILLYTPELFTLDHIHPISKGGTNARENLRACCKRCNTLKANFSVDEFRELFFIETGYWFFYCEPKWKTQGFAKPLWRRENLKYILRQIQNNRGERFLCQSI